MSDPNTTVVAGYYADPVVAIGGPPPGAVVANGKAQPGRVTIPAEQGPVGPKGDTGSVGPPGQAPSFIAGVSLSGHRALMFQPDGTVVPADPNVSPYVFAGISLGAAQVGASVQATIEGPIIEPTWEWTPLFPVYVAAPGLLTQSPPAFGLFHLIGFAITATSLFLSPTLPTLLA